MYGSRFIDHSLAAVRVHGEGGGCAWWDRHSRVFNWYGWTEENPTLPKTVFVINLNKKVCTESEYAIILKKGTSVA